MKLRLQYVTSAMGRGDLYQIVDRRTGVFQLNEPLPFDEADKALKRLQQGQPAQEEWSLAIIPWGWVKP